MLLVAASGWIAVYRELWVITPLDAHTRYTREKLVVKVHSGFVAATLSAHTIPLPIQVMLSQLPVPEKGHIAVPPTPRRLANRQLPIPEEGHIAMPPTLKRLANCQLPAPEKGCIAVPPILR